VSLGGGRRPRGRSGRSVDPGTSGAAPVLGFSRLSAAAYAVIRRVIDDDGTFRARVAARAEEAEVGRAGWLWLHRPVDWADDPVFAAGEPSGVAGGASRAAPSDALRSDAGKERSAKLRRQVAELQDDRRRLTGEVAEQRRVAEQAEAGRASAEARSAELQEERNAAVRTAKAIEADLATARRDLKAARAATRQAEAELAALRAAGPQGLAEAPTGDAATTTSSAAGSGASALPPAPAPVPSPWSEVPVESVAASVEVAAEAAAQLSRALADVAQMVGRPPSTAEEAGASSGSLPPGGGAVIEGSSAQRGRRGASQRPSRRGRRTPALPPGVFDGSEEAVRHMVCSADNLVVVDGYNLARAAWSGLAPEEERRRTVALLEELQARSGGPLVVVFDGDGSVVAPLASKHLRVRFSDAGQTADELIADLLAAVPVDQAAVVVSSDRAVAADARRQGRSLWPPRICFVSLVVDVRAPA
jgi:hypothetical protein